MTDRPLLLQEILMEQDPSGWRMLVGCILLNQTTRAQVDCVRDELFRRWPSAESLVESSSMELTGVIRPCGLQARRAGTLVRFSEWWLSCLPSLRAAQIRELEPPGVGEYAAQSWDIFKECVEPRGKVTDHALAGYLAGRVGASGVIW